MVHFVTLGQRCPMDPTYERVHILFVVTIHLEDELLFSMVLYGAMTVERIMRNERLRIFVYIFA